MRERWCGQARLNELPEQVQPASRLAAVSPPTVERPLSRALRLLRRTSPSPVEVEIDEEATAERAAREGLWLSSCVPVRERWRDMVLVVVRSSSMVVWRRTVDQLATVLVRAGAFRTVRVQWITFDHLLPAGPAGDRSGPDRERGGGRSPVDGIPPRGKRAVLVLTDGIGAAWADESGKRALARWARRATVAVLHVLNQGHWHHTGLTSEWVRVRVPELGAPNGTWQRPDGAPSGRRTAGLGAGARGAVAAPLGAAGDPALGPRPRHPRTAAGGAGRVLGAGTGTPVIPGRLRRRQ